MCTSDCHRKLPKYIGKLVMMVDSREGTGQLVGREGREAYLVCVCALSHVQLFDTPWTEAPQAPLSMGFPRQN